jgi:hypothetical protein
MRIKSASPIAAPCSSHSQPFYPQIRHLQVERLNHPPFHGNAPTIGLGKLQVVFL